MGRSSLLRRSLSSHKPHCCAVPATPPDRWDGDKTTGQGDARLSVPTQAAFILAVNGLCVEGACTQPGPEPLAASGAKLGPWGQTLQRTAGGMWWQSSPTGPQRDVVPASPGLVSARSLAASGGRPWEAEAKAEAGAGSRAWGEAGQLLASTHPPPSAGHDVPTDPGGGSHRERALSPASPARWAGAAPPGQGCAHEGWPAGG